VDDVLMASQGGPAPTPSPTITPGGPTLTPEPIWKLTDSFPESGPELTWGYRYTPDLVVPMQAPCPGGDGYVYRVGDAKGWHAAFSGSPDLSNYYVETYLYLPVDGDVRDWERLGLFLRGQDCSSEGHKYSYAITMDTDDGHTRAGKYANGTLEAWRSQVFSNSGWHKLQIQAQGDTIRFYIDDVLFEEHFDESYSSGQFGFIHYETGSLQTVHYTRVDNLEAGSLPRIYGTATPTPTGPTPTWTNTRTPTLTPTPTQTIDWKTTKLNFWMVY